MSLTPKTSRSISNRHSFNCNMADYRRAEVVAQLVERLILTPEVCSLSPVIGNLHIANILTINCIEKTKIKKKEAGNGLFKKNLFAHHHGENR